MSGSATIWFYGGLADRIGRRVALDLGPLGCTVAQLRAQLASAHPAAAAELIRRGTRACAGDRVVGEDHLVCAGDEIDFLPPLSGG